MTDHGTTERCRGAYDDGTNAAIYYRDMKKSPSSWDNKQGIELASGVGKVNETIFKISGDGESVLYLKDYDQKNGGKLYLHNLHDEILVDDHVTQYHYSNKPALLYYTTMNAQGDLNSYLLGIADVVFYTYMSLMAGSNEHKSE